MVILDHFLEFLCFFDIFCELFFSKFMSNLQVKEETEDELSEAQAERVERTLSSENLVGGGFVL